MLNAAALSTLFLTACGHNAAGQGEQEQTLHLMEGGEIMSLDHSNEANIHQQDVLENTMEGLYRANHKGDPIPALATSVVKPTNHGKRYTYNLRKKQSGQMEIL